jgi:nitrogen fixation protein NifZ
MRPRFDYGDAVRVIRNVRNDGTFPGQKTGNLLVRREEELIDKDEPWVETRFESRERVRSALALGLNGEVVVQPGSIGEIIRVVRNEQGNLYHVLFTDKVFVVPERGLEALQEVEGDHE